MLKSKYGNFCYGVIGAGGITADQGVDTTFLITPDATSGALPDSEFTLIVYSSACSAPHTCSNREGILIKSRTGNTLTIQGRNAVDGGTQQAWSAGDKYLLAASAENMTEINDVVNARFVESRSIAAEILRHPNIVLLDAVETGWTQEAATFAWDTTDFRFGGKSGKLTTTSGSFNAVCYKNMNFNGAGKTLSIWLKKSSTITGATLFVLAPNWSNYAVFSLGVANYPNNAWFNLIFPIEGMSKTGSPNFSNIAMLRIEAIGSVNTATLHFDDIRIASSNLDKGAILITFDDGNDSDFIYAKTKMDEYGYRGTAYINGNQVGQSGKLTLAQMKAMHELGWDISSHSWSHPYYTSLSEEQMMQETISMKHYLAKNGFASGARFFAYPYGAANETAFNVVSRYHLVARGAGAFGVNLGISNVPLFSSYLMECASVINTTSTADLNTWLANVKNGKALGCILFHRLVTSSPTEYQYLVDNFNTFIDAVAASGVSVITMSDLVDKLLTAEVKTQDPMMWINIT